ncbi:nucleoside monophosphate kinase [Candidatus Babeliales bacterium]|nr:nucleoside monophosphate kinase [Candidatus Babeliales bacterium]MCF7899092.1 nucleoside monophosphate kinase [Candidatus Babeliales bacterium]
MILVLVVPEKNIKNVVAIKRKGNMLLIKNISKINMLICLILLTALTSCKKNKDNESKNKIDTKGNSMQKIQPKTIFSFFGAPGSGKGTLAEQAVEKFGFLSLSTGDLLRENISKGTQIGKKVKDFLDSGQLVPDELVTDMVQNWLIEKKETGKSIILDGFPRTKEQTQNLIDIINENLPEYKLRVIALDIPEEEILARLTGRRICSNKECKAVFNISEPGIKDGGKCPKCGGTLIIRQDDKPEVIKDRFDVYKKNETEILDFYKSAGKNIETLDISKLNKEEVFDKFNNIL